MPMASDQERTERATPKRREEARRRGQVAKSREASATAVYLAVIVVLYFWGPTMLRTLLSVTRGVLAQAAALDVDKGSLELLALQLLGRSALIVGPLFAAGLAAAVLGNVLQFGFLFTGEALALDLNRLNPVEGFGRFFSKQALAEMAKSLLKLGAVAYLAFGVVRREMGGDLPGLAGMDSWGITAYTARVSFGILVRVFWFLVVLSVLDYAFQRWQYEERLKMTRQEVKDEYKQREGDPQVKARVRAIQREMARRRMLAEVPEADVVVTNPTRLAVALAYDPARAPAPRVVAKGADFLAEKIREVAREHGVPVVEDKPLARALYHGVKVGGLIPENLYRAVAEVLAYVYRLQGRGPAGHA